MLLGAAGGHAAERGAASTTSPATAPANPRATPQTRAVLEFFWSLSGGPERKILSGQFTDFGMGASLELMQDVYRTTGQWPAILGVDFADVPSGALTSRAPARVAIEYWRRGGLVHVSAHMGNPANPRGGGLRDEGVNLEDLLRSGSETHRRWMQQLNEIAAGLQELRNAGVVVLWRPFHEMNSRAFWWGASEPATFIRVWRHMFDYFSNTRNLDNLLWVYSPLQGARTAAYYPGDAYVDLVGLDAYTDFVGPDRINGYAEVAALPKPFGFPEFGPYGSNAPPGDYDYRRFLDGLTQHFPRAVYFMSWNGNWSLARNRFTRELLNDPRIANRGDLPRQLFGTAAPTVTRPAER
jgi:mannan endo-1,4-beta-mannosidase